MNRASTTVKWAKHLPRVSTGPLGRKCQDSSLKEGGDGEPDREPSHYTLPGAATKQGTDSVRGHVTSVDGPHELWLIEI